VDSLCIIQDNSIDVCINVQSMGVIFGNSELTVVAASATGANYGLAGVRLGTRRFMQGREVVHRMALGLPLAPLDEVIENSTWGSRGWTYQEIVLSKRMLVFTDSQMHYKCVNGCTACEETLEDAYQVSKWDKNIPRGQLHSYAPKMMTKTAASD
jgi:hypothetical protein